MSAKQFISNVWLYFSFTAKLFSFVYIVLKFANIKLVYVFVLD